MFLFNKIFEKRAIKSYLAILPRFLVRQFGTRDSYTYHQVESALKKCNLSFKYSHYAVALFCTRAQYSQYIQSSKHSFDFESVSSNLNILAPFIMRGNSLPLNTKNLLRKQELPSGFKRDHDLGDFE
jgi:hypothetical protein